MKKDTIQINYSKEQLHQLLWNCRFDSDYFLWKKSRQFITKAIHKDGTFLDIGCANGFLLKCLMSWSKYSLDPYGIDHRSEAIEQARQLFVDLPDHFEIISGDKLKNLSQTHFPKQFDFVYRNYWRAEPKDPKLMRKILIELMDYVKPAGRLLMGVYFGIADNKSLNAQKRQQDRFLKFILQFKKSLNHYNGEAFSPSNHWVGWIDKN